MVAIKTLGDIDRVLNIWPIQVTYFESPADENEHVVAADDGAATGHKYDGVIKFFKENAGREIDYFEIGYNGYGLDLEVVFKEED